MTGAPFDVTNVRRVKIVQECSTSVDLRDVVERRILMNARFQKTMTARILKDSLLLMTIICLISVVGAAETADNTEYEIDKVYGRPNIEQMYPTHMDDGTTAYRRSNEIHRKRESNRQMIDTAYHYNGPNNLNSIILNKIGHSPRTFHYKEENGCDKTIHYVLWPFLNNEPQFHSQQYYKAKFGDGLAYHPDLQRFPYGTSLKKQLVSDYQDKKTVEHHIYGSSHGQQPLLVDSSSLEQQLPPINHKNNIGVIYNAHAEKNHADKLKKYDSTQPVNEDYVPRPAGGYGFKKLIVPVEDAYNQKAYRPPRFDLSDFLFPAEENDFYTQPLPYDVDNVNKVPDYTPQPSSHSSYKEHNADLVDQTLYSKKSREYVGGSHEYADGGIDKFGPLPFKEKINYDGHKKSKKYSIKNNQLYDSHSVEEDYTPNERDEFGELPYKERVVSSENSEEYDDHSPVSYTEQPASSSNGEEEFAPSALFLKKKLGRGRVIGLLDSDVNANPTVRKAISSKSATTKNIDVKNVISAEAIVKASNSKLTTKNVSNTESKGNILSNDFLKSTSISMSKGFSIIPLFDENDKHVTETNTFTSDSAANNSLIQDIGNLNETSDNLVMNKNVTTAVTIASTSSASFVTTIAVTLPSDVNFSSEAIDVSTTAATVLVNDPNIGFFERNVSTTSVLEPVTTSTNENTTLATIRSLTDVTTSILNNNNDSVPFVTTTAANFNNSTDTAATMSLLNTVVINKIVSLAKTATIPTEAPLSEMTAETSTLNFTLDAVMEDVAPNSITSSTPVFSTLLKDTETYATTSQTVFQTMNNSDIITKLNNTELNNNDENAVKDDNNDLLSVIPLSVTLPENINVENDTTFADSQNAKSTGNTLPVSVTTTNTVETQRHKESDLTTAATTSNDISTITIANIDTTKSEGDGRDKRNVSRKPLKSPVQDSLVKTKPKNLTKMRPITAKAPVFESSHALLLSSSWNVDDTTSTINPSTIFTSTTTAGVTSTTNQPVIAALMAVDYMAALARAEEEAKKLTEPGPQAVCPGQRTAIQNCSSFFTCNSTGTLVSCWAELGSDDPSQLVFDPTSQECRKFSAIKECTMENVCANGSKFTLLGGECTRLAYNCPGEIITCGAGHAVDSATHACVPETSQLACSPLLQRLQNQ